MLPSSRLAGSIVPFFALILPSLAAATTIHVPAEQPTIQAGIDAAVAGDSVLVAPGTYVENINFCGKAIVVAGFAGPASTTIDGGGAGIVVTFDSGETPASVLTGFKITNGRSSFRGGGIGCLASSPTVTGNLITENHATGGGGVYCAYSNARIIDNVIDSNFVVGVGGGGGGILCDGYSAPLITQNIISSNSAQGTFSGGAGIKCVSSPAQIEYNNITKNTTSDIGGGIVFAEGSHGTIIGNRISYNADGGIFCSVSEAVITDNVIVDNEGWATGAIHIMFGSPVVSRNTISGYDCTSGFGAGLLCQEQGSPFVEANIFAFSINARGVRCIGGQPTLSCNDIFGNALGDEPCGIVLDGNFAADPGFCNPAQGDYTLNGASPCAPGNAPPGCEQIGALPVGCGATVVEVTSWGAIKASFR